MPTGIPKPVAPHLIAMHGHIAAALRTYMTEHDTKPGDLNQLLGLPRGHVRIYQYLRARQAPSKTIRVQLHKVTGIPLASLTARGDIDGNSATQIVVHEPKQPMGNVLRPLNPNPVLAFTVSADGTARIKLDAALPLSVAAPLLRILLDAGIVPTGDNNDTVQ